MLHAQILLHLSLVSDGVVNNPAGLGAVFLVLPFWSEGSTAVFARPDLLALFEDFQDVEFRKGKVLFRFQFRFQFPTNAFGVG